MASHWLLPGSVLVGSALIALAIIWPTFVSSEDAGRKARRECESLVREGKAAELTEPERAIQACILRRAGLG